MASEENPSGDQAKEREGELTLRILLDPAEDTPTYYVNYAEVSRSQYEIGIALARLPTKLSRAQLAEVQNSRGLVIKPLLQLVLPPVIIPGLIQALQTQLEQYEKPTVPVPTRGSEERVDE